VDILSTAATTGNILQESGWHWNDTYYI